MFTFFKQNYYFLAALNYGIFRTKSFNETSPMYMMFYDMGAYGTQVSVVSYQLIKSKDRIAPELQPHLAVLGVGFVFSFKSVDKKFMNNKLF